MSRHVRRALIALAAAALAIVCAPPSPAAAHGGAGEERVTSNYRTHLTDVPDIDGLTVEVVDIDGTIELTWTGDGTLIVIGYEDEPYLRFDSSGVYQNQRSPATYLNQNRYADVDPPATVDASAPPEWRQLSPGRTARWHDHRTHWMSTTPPFQVRQEPDRQHLIIERWEIPLTIADRSVVLAGTLTWTPPPPLVPWLVVAALVAVVTAGLLWSRWSRLTEVVVAAVATGAYTIDTVGYVALSPDTLPNRIWEFVYPAAAGLATVRLVVHARRRTAHRSLAMFVTGLILALMGGFDRVDVITKSEVFSAVPATWTRIATVLCVGIGTALTIRFVVFLAQLSPARSSHPSPESLVDEAVQSMLGKRDPT